jgi:hypothetical protein
MVTLYSAPLKPVHASRINEIENGRLYTTGWQMLSVRTLAMHAAQPQFPLR